MALRLRSRPKGRPTKSARRAAPRARLARKTRQARIDCPSRPSQTDRAAGTAQRTGAEAGEAGTKRKDKTERPSESRTQGQSKTKRRPARARKAMERKAKQKGTKLEEKRRKADQAEKEKGEREGGGKKEMRRKGASLGRGPGWCPEPGSNRHEPFNPRDFKSLVSTNFTIRAVWRRGRGFQPTRKRLCKPSHDTLPPRHVRADVCGGGGRN